MTSEHKLKSGMAKWGEGDPRWIVEERADATNVNNWHWYVCVMIVVQSESVVVFVVVDVVCFLLLNLLLCCHFFHLISQPKNNICASIPGQRKMLHNGQRTNSSLC